MKKTTINKSKLAGYTAAAGAVVAGSAVNAQIVYTNVNPDVVIDSLTAPYQLDFNNDATPDLQFAVQNLIGSGSQSGIQFTYAGAGAVVQWNAGGAVQGVNTATASGSSFAVSALNSGDAISSAANFGTGTYAPLALDAAINAGSFGTFPVQQGNFLGVSNKFLGAKFVAGTNTHYGWVQLSVAADATTITIHDYAFVATPDAGLNAGQTVSLEGIAVGDKVSIKTMLDEASINVTPDLIGGTMVITNMAGQEVKTEAISDVNSKINYAGLGTGVYILEARFDSGSVNKKIYVR